MASMTTRRRRGSLVERGEVAVDGSHSDPGACRDLVPARRGDALLVVLPRVASTIRRRVCSAAAALPSCRIFAETFVDGFLRVFIVPRLSSPNPPSLPQGVPACPPRLPPPHPPNARGQPRWFFGMLAAVRAAAADTAGQYTLLEMIAPAGLRPRSTCTTSRTRASTSSTGWVTIPVGDDIVELGAGQHAFGPRGIPHSFIVGPDGARMLWVLTPGGFENFRGGSVPAETPTVPPPSVPPPANAAEIMLRYGNELLPE